MSKSKIYLGVGGDGGNAARSRVSARSREFQRSSSCPISSPAYSTIRTLKGHRRDGDALGTCRKSHKSIRVVDGMR